MTILNQVIGVSGEFITSLLLVPVLIILWLITRKIPSRKDSTSHINIFVTIWITIAFHIIVICAAVMNSHFNGFTYFYPISDLLFIFMFYSGFLQFNKRALMKQIIFYSAGILSLIISIWSKSETVMTCMTLAVVAGVWYVYSDHMPFSKKAKWSIYIFAFSKGSMLIAILLSNGQPLFIFLGITCLVMSYVLVLSMNIEYLITILKGTYESSISDPLTGLYNRKYFTDCVQNCIIKNLPAAIIFIDIDNFKKLNDSQGHAKGDEILRTVAKIFLEETEGIGISGRYGGEEIVALIVEPESDLEVLTERIRARIEQEASFDVPDGKYMITASMGYAHYQPDWSPTQFIKAADKAMYIAKRTGKNKVVRYGSEDFPSSEGQTDGEGGVVSGYTKSYECQDEVQ